MSSMAEVKTDSGKVEGPVEEVASRDLGGTLVSAVSPKSVLVVQQRSQTLSKKRLSPSSKVAAVA